ncbi:MAG: MFS transporter [Rhodobacteraceae bacterium]|nr:MFS transporter [Paracoccaceae bacterium]
MGFLTFLRANAPFLGAGALLAFTSSYGQTYFISLFAGEIRGAFGLSHGAWGGIYTVGTMISAVVMIWAGVLTDRFRVRHLGAIVAVVLALACLLMAGAQNGAMLILAVFLLRFAGQGMMSHLSVVAMARWFVATRGRALSIAAMGFSFGQAILPILFVALLVRFDWRWLWLLAAVMVLLTMPVLARLPRAERTPQSIARQTQSVGMQGRHWTRRDVLHHWLFWMMVPVLLGPPAWGTALFFQQVHLTEVKGWALVDYVALMPLFTAAALGATLVAGALIDRFGSAVLAMAYMVPYVVSFVIMAAAETLFGAAISLVVFALGSGIQATVPAALWAEFFGTRHLGSIKALSAALMVFGSAIGPGISGVLIDWGLSFPQQMWGYAVYFAVAGVIITLGLLPARKLLPSAPEVDIQRT